MIDSLQAILVQREPQDANSTEEVLRVGPEDVWLLRGGVSALNKCDAIMKAESTSTEFTPLRLIIGCLRYGLYRSRILCSAYFPERTLPS